MWQEDTVNGRSTVEYVPLSDIPHHKATTLLPGDDMNLLSSNHGGSPATTASPERRDSDSSLSSISPLTLSPASHSPLLGGYKYEADDQTVDPEAAWQSLNERFPEHNPQLSCFSKIKKRFNEKYDAFAYSCVGLILRSIAKSVPQAVILAGASAYSTSGLITPIVLKEAGSEDAKNNYYYYGSIAEISFLFFTLLYDSSKRFKSYLHNEDYNSFGIFRLRATFMGAALGGLLMKEVINHTAPDTNPWLTFFITLPATLFPAYLRYRYFKHDIIPTPLKSEKPQEKIITTPKQTADASKPGTFNNPTFNAVAAGCTAAGSALFVYRIVKAIPLHDYRPLTVAKIISAAVPFLVGGVVKFSEKKLPSFIPYRWKQLEVLASEGSILFLSFAGLLLGFNKENRFEDFQKVLLFCILPTSLFLAGIQAARLKKPFKFDNNDPGRTIMNNC